MRKLLFLAMVTGLMAGVVSCKKYEDGPLISFRSKKARLVNNWVIDKVYNKGVDVTAQYPKDSELDINDDQTYSVVSNGVTATGKWAFSDDKTQLYMTWDNSGMTDTLTITRLKNKEFNYKKNELKEVIEFYMVQKP